MQQQKVLTSAWDRESERESWQVSADGWYWIYVHLHVLMPATQLGPVNTIVSTEAKLILNVKQFYNSVWKMTLDSLMM